MAKLTIEVDTDVEGGSVQINGEKVDNVQSVSIYNGNYDVGKGPLFYFEVTTYESNDGVRKMTRLSASEQGGSPSKAYAGWYEKDGPTKAQRDIASMFGRGTPL